MYVRPLDQAAVRYSRKSLMAYLEGEQNLKWITRIIGCGDEAMRMHAELLGYGRPERYRQLSKWFDSQRKED
jgi:hypothetical protein